MHQHLSRNIVPLTFICISLFLVSFVQAKISIQGTWKIDHVSLSDQFTYDPATEAQLSQIASALKGSSLTLEKRGRASFNTEVPQLLVTDARWIFNNEEGRLLVTDKSNEKIVFMEFLVVANSEQTLFYLSESPFVFEMNRIENE